MQTAFKLMLRSIYRAARQGESKVQAQVAAYTGTADLAPSYIKARRHSPDELLSPLMQKYLDLALHSFSK